MSETQDAQGEWHKRKTLVADWEFWQVWADDREVCDFCTQADADLIIADHSLEARLRDMQAEIDRLERNEVDDSKWHHGLFVALVDAGYKAGDRTVMLANVRTLIAKAEELQGKAALADEAIIACEMPRYWRDRYDALTSKQASE